LYAICVKETRNVLNSIAYTDGCSANCVKCFGKLLKVLKNLS